MIKILLRLIFLLIPLQLVILSLGYQAEISARFDELEYRLLAFFVLFIFFSPALYFFRRDDRLLQPDVGAKATVSRVYFSRVIAFLLICIVIVTNSSMPEFSKTLVASQDVANLGLLFKTATTIAPALAFSVLVLRPNSISAVVSLLAAFVASVQVSLVFLTKAPLVPYILLAVYFLYGPEKQVSSRVKLVSTVAAVGLMFAAQLVYFGRVSGDYEISIVALISQLIFRVILIPETVVIVAQENTPLFSTNMSEFFQHVTNNIYGYDSRFIGVAPGYAGFFILNYGFLFGFLFSAILSFFVSRILTFCKGDSYFGLILYFMISIDLIHFFTDGNPSIITSTSGSKFFLALVFGVFVLWLKELAPKRPSLS